MVARGAAAPCAEVISAYCSSLLKIIVPEREKWWWWPSALGTIMWWLITYDLKLHLHHHQHLRAGESHKLMKDSRQRLSCSSLHTAVALACSSITSSPKKQPLNQPFKSLMRFYGPNLGLSNQNEHAELFKKEWLISLWAQAAYLMGELVPPAARDNP